MKKDLAPSHFLKYSLPVANQLHLTTKMPQFAIYRNQAVIILGFEENEVLISFDNGHEEYVDIETLDILS